MKILENIINMKDCVYTWTNHLWTGVLATAVDLKTYYSGKLKPQM